MKRICLLLAICCLLPTAALAQFTDIKPANPAYPAISKLVRDKVLEVGKNKKFNPRGSVNRYQLAVVLDRAYAALFPGKTIPERSALEFFNDVPLQSYAFSAVGHLAALKVLDAAPNRKFSGNLTINRYYFYYLMCRFIETAGEVTLTPAFDELAYADLPQSDPYYPYIQKLVGAGLLPGGKFRYLNGKAPLTRLEMAVFTVRTMDFMVPEEKRQKPVSAPTSPTAPVEAPSELAKDYGYADVAQNHYAREAINELIEVGIFPSGAGRSFNGEWVIDKYQLYDLLAKTLERLLLGQEGELDMADASLGYKDVETTNPYFPSIQKLIGLGLLSPGNREEMLNGSLPITRYQLIFFLMSPIEKVLAEKLEFKEADSGQAYRDVPREVFAYPVIQKAIWLGVLPGGADKEFKGDQYATRFDLAFISVQLLKQVYLKIREEAISLAPSPDYGFKVMLGTTFNYNSIAGGKPTGEDLVDMSGQQTLNLTVNRSIGRNLFGYAQLQDSFSFGTQALQYINVNEANLSGMAAPLSFQMGRIYTFNGYSPFGSSLFFDRTADLAQLSYDTFLGNLSGTIGKLIYNGDVTTDSNFGSVFLVSQFAPFELSLGSQLVTDIIDPTWTAQLNSRVAQTYAGAKMNLTGALELNAEVSNVDFSDPSAMQYIGVTDEVQTSAYQFAVSYYQPDYAYSLSLGYRHVGDDFYNGGLSSLGLGQDSILIKSKFDISAEEYINVNINSIYQQGALSQYVLNGTYSRRLFRLAYLTLGASRTFDQSSAAQNSTLNVNGNLSVSF